MNRKTGAMISYVLMFLEIIFALFFTPYIIRSLGDAEYGVYKLTESISSYLLLLDLGIGQAVVRWMAKYRVVKDANAQSRFLGFATLLYLFIGALTFVVGQVLIALMPRFFSVGLNAEEVMLAQKLLKVTVINAAVTLGTVGYINTIIAYERFIFSKGISIMQIIARVLLYYLALEFGWGSYGIVLMQTILTVVTRTASVLYVLYVIKIKPSFKNFERKFVKEVLNYSILIFLLMISTQINNTLDNVILAAFVPNSAVLLSIYGVALQLTYYYNSVGDGLTGVLMPGVVRLVENGASSVELMKEMIRIGRFVLAFSAFVWIEFLVCGKEFILLWVGENYLEAYYIALPLLTVYMVMQTQSIGDNMLNAKNEIKEMTIMRIIVIFINVIVSLILIKWNPMMGVMIGTFVSLVLGGVFVKNYLFKKKLGIQLKLYFKEMMSGIAICIIITSIVGFLVRDCFGKSPNFFFVNVIVVGVIFAVTMWFFGFKQTERTYLLNLFSKINFRGRLHE